MAMLLKKQYNLVALKVTLTTRGYSGSVRFELEVTEENSDDVPEGRVISQTPSSGKGFKDDEIALVVSKGPVMVEVPSLGAQSVEDATAALEELGFRVKVEKTALYVGIDRVVKQSPGGGESAPKGSTVTLHVV